MIVNKYSINKVVKSLKNNNIVLVPTETVFGVAVVYDNKKAYEKLMKLKNRPTDKHFPICVGSYSQIETVAETNEYVKKLLPNPLTLILQTKNLPKHLENDTVAIRYPRDKFLNKVCKKLDKPILLTSANLSGQEPITNIKEAVELFKNKIDIYVKGKVKIGKASTIVKITNNKVEILREGPIDKETIYKMIK